MLLERILWVKSVRIGVRIMLRPTVGRPVYFGMKHPSGAYDQIFITVRRLRVCWCGALSLTRRRVCSLLLLLALASAVIFGSDSRGTRDNMLLSQIREFPFHRFLRLTALRWRYSTSPPHGVIVCTRTSPIPFYHCRRPGYETPSWRIVYFVSAATACLSTCCHGNT
jgi:hypothetical protein